MINMYLAFATDLNHLLSGARAVRITVPDYMPLSVEEIGTSIEGHRLVSLCHYGEQNGDLMRDPDIVFLFHNLSHGAAAEPVSYRNDYLRIVQDVYRYDEAGRRTHIVPTLKQELEEFARALVCHAPRARLLCPHGSSTNPVHVSSSIHSRSMI